MHRNDPPRCTRLFTPGSSGSNDDAGPWRVPCDARRRGQRGVVVGPIPVAHPLPDVAAHVVEPIAVGRELGHRGDAREAIGGAVLVGEVSLVGVGHPLAVAPERVAPRIDLAGQAAARGEFPFGLRGQALAGPGRVGDRIFVGDVHDGERLAAADRAGRTERMPPVRALHVRPPLEWVVDRHGMVGRREDDRSGDQGLGRHAGKVGRARRPLGHGDVPGGRHERRELRVGDLGAVHPEAVDVGPMDRPRVGGGLHPDGVVHVGGSCAPIENSPPGIHAMPSGAAPGAVVVFSMVGRNAAPAGVVIAAGAWLPPTADREARPLPRRRSRRPSRPMRPAGCGVGPIDAGPWRGATLAHLRL